MKLLAMTNKNQIVILIFVLLQGSLVSCQTIPENPREVIENKIFGNEVVWFGEFVSASRVLTNQGEHLVIGVFRQLDADVVSLENINYPIIARDKVGGLFTTGIVLKKEHLKEAIHLEKKGYSELSPFILVKGIPESLLSMDGSPVVRLKVLNAFNIKRSEVNVSSVKSGH